jgi:hypothetical protein
MALGGRGTKGFVTKVLTEALVLGSMMLEEGVSNIIENCVTSFGWMTPWDKSRSLTSFLDFRFFFHLFHFQL